MLPAGEKFELMALLSRRAAKNNMPSVQIYSTVFVTKPINIFLLPFFKKGINTGRVYFSTKDIGKSTRELDFVDEYKSYDLHNFYYELLNTSYPNLPFYHTLNR